MTLRHAIHHALRTLLASGLLTLAVHAQVQTAPGDSLRYDEVIRQVVNTNDRAAAARFMEEAARRTVRGTGAWPDPMFMLGLQNVPTNGKLNEDPMTMKMIGLSQEIPLGGSRGAEKRAAEAGVEVSTEMRRMTERELRSAAQIAYAELYFKRQALQDMVAQYDLLDQVIDGTRARIETNQASQDEYLSLQAEKWRTQANLLMYEVEVERARFTLNSLRGVDPAALIADVAPPTFAAIPDSAQPWIALAREQSPELRQIRAQARQYGSQASAESGMRWPMVRLSGSYGFRGSVDGVDAHTGEAMDEDLDNMFNVGVEFSLPLFSRRSKGSMAQAMKAMQASSEVAEKQAARDIESRIQGLQLEALHLDQTVMLFRDRIVPTDEDAFRSALAQYQTNRGSLSAVLNAASAIFRDRLTLRDYQIQLARTLAQAGTYIEPDLPPPTRNNAPGGE